MKDEGERYKPSQGGRLLPGLTSILSLVLLIIHSRINIVLCFLTAMNHLLCSHSRCPVLVVPLTTSAKSSCTLMFVIAYFLSTMQTLVSYFTATRALCSHTCATVHC